MQLYEPARLIVLWSIPVLLLLFLWGEREWRKRISSLGKKEFLSARLMPGFSRERRQARWVLLLLIFLFSAIALARPQWGEEKKRVERKGVDILFLLDTSLSMLAEDIKPSRLGKAKLEIRNMIRRLGGDRVGMIGFAGSGFLQCPLTLDYSAFLLFIDAIKVGYIPQPGTSLAQAIESGIRAFPEKSRKYRAMIVFSDGEDHEGGVAQAVAAAAKSGVRIYTVGLGTEEGEPIPLRPSAGEKVSGYKKDRNGQVVITRLNAPLLTEIAKETGGLYLPATPAEQEIDILLKHLESLGERQLKERLITEREDHFQLFLALALLLLMGESLLSARMGKSIRMAALSLLAFVVFTGFIDTPRSLVKKGNQLVEEKKYQSAVEAYRKAEVARPAEPAIRYNLGTSLYHLYEYRDAERELEQALAQVKDPQTKSKILYNYGNTKYRLGDFEKAIEAYKKVLDLNPKDKDAKYNLEFLQQKKALFEKKQEERQKEEKKEQPQPQQQQDQQQQQQQRQQEQEQQERERQQQEQQQQQEQKEKQERQEPQAGEEEEKKEREGRQEQPEKEEGEEKEQPAQAGKEEEKKQEPEEKPGEHAQEMKPEEKEGERPEEREGPRPQPLQGQMSEESALRLLNALQEGERKLQDLRQPPAPSEPYEPAKDW